VVLAQDFGQIQKITKRNSLLILVIGHLLGKTLERVKASIFDAPVISTNLRYLKQVKQHLKKHNIKKFKIVLEPVQNEIQHLQF
jgi:N-methylhydantoinase A/oxoprolinase/acetone carboxylase beta subunit